MGHFELMIGDGPQPYYFVLKAGNGKVIATSEMYSSKQAAQDGISSVQTNARTTDIVDKTLDSSMALGNMTMMGLGALGKNILNNK
ncbi:TPA: YegP family protein [Vibrio parahaemolyticus]|nr:YegP family protein [Vibrio parahaemolyticus]